MGPLRHCHRKLLHFSGAEVGGFGYFRFRFMFPCRSLYLPKVPLLPLGVFLSAGVPFGLSPALLAARLLSATSLCQVRCVLRVRFLPYLRPLSYLDNCTSERHFLFRLVRFRFLRYLSDLRLSLAEIKPSTY